jgi:hypothetical protein
MSRKLFCAAFTVFLCFTLAPAAAFGEIWNGGSDDSGYSYDTDTKILTVTTNDGTKVWRDDGDDGNFETIRDNVESVVIGSGVTTIGEQAFLSCSSLETVTFEGDSTLTTIEES